MVDACSHFSKLLGMTDGRVLKTGELLKSDKEFNITHCVDFNALKTHYEDLQNKYFELLAENIDLKKSNIEKIGKLLEAHDRINDLKTSLETARQQRKFYKDWVINGNEFSRNGSQ